ncbi:hypothetical protein HGA89_05265, partial [bacterium]|nr:hypothetical protein [bacterium]
RPVKRVIQREVQDRLADAILAGTVMPGRSAELDWESGGFALHPQT